MWMRASLGNLGCRFFPFITLNILCHAILACRVSAEKSADKLMGVPFYVVSFPLLLLIFFFILNFCQFDYHSLMCSSLGLSAWDSLLLLGLGWLFPFPCWWSFQQYFSSNIFSGPFCLSAPYGTPRMWMLMHLMCHRSLWLSSFFLNIFFLYSVLWHWFISLCPPGHLSVLCLSRSALDSF